MSERRWSKFWWQDWQREPALRVCSLAARGLWMEMLCLAHEGEPHGHVTVGGKPATKQHLSKLCGASEKEVASLVLELEDAGVFSRTEDGTIYCRRMVRDKAFEEKQRAFGSSGGNPALKPNGVGGHNPTLKGRSKAPLGEGDKFLESESESEAETEGSTHTIPVRVVGAHPRGVCDDPDFEAFWQRYPRRDDKGHARKAWKTALSRASPDQIIAGLERYQFSENPRFRPLPATWLNGERWCSDTMSEDEAILRAAGVPLDDPPIFDGRLRPQ